MQLVHLTGLKNEHVIRKALKISVEVTERELNEDKKLLLSDGQAVRILPNERSIGFFIACIKKPIDDSDGSLLEGGYLIH